MAIVARIARNDRRDRLELVFRKGDSVCSNHRCEPAATQLLDEADSRFASVNVKREGPVADAGRPAGPMKEVLEVRQDRLVDLQRSSWSTPMRILRAVPTLVDFGLLIAGYDRLNSQD